MLPGHSAAETDALASGAIPLAAPLPDAFASGLQIALLHTEALVSLGHDCSSAFLTTLASLYQSRTAEAQEAAQSDSEAGARKLLVSMLQHEKCVCIHSCALITYR